MWNLNVKYVEEYIDFRKYLKYYIIPSHYKSLIQRLYTYNSYKNQTSIMNPFALFKRKAK